MLPEVIFSQYAVVFGEKKLGWEKKLGREMFREMINKLPKP